MYLDLNKRPENGIADPLFKPRAFSGNYEGWEHLEAFMRNSQGQDESALSVYANLKTYLPQNFEKLVEDLDPKHLNYAFMGTVLLLKGIKYIKTKVSDKYTNLKKSLEPNPFEESLNSEPTQPHLSFWQRILSGSETEIPLGFEPLGDLQNYSGTNSTEKTVEDKMKDGEIAFLKGDRDYFRTSKNMLVDFLEHSIYERTKNINMDNDVTYPISDELAVLLNTLAADGLSQEGLKRVKYLPQEELAAMIAKHSSLNPKNGNPHLRGKSDIKLGFLTPFEEDGGYGLDPD